MTTRGRRVIEVTATGLDHDTENLAQACENPYGF
jgi:hypothetical protein